MRDLIAAVLMVIGTALMFVASLGVLRMPDLFMRMSASTKATTLGIASILAGAALFLHDIGASSRTVAIVLFVGLTTPVAGHMIARAAYNSGVPLWKGTVVDELRGRYDREKHRLESYPASTMPQVQDGDVAAPESPGSTLDTGSSPNSQ